MGHKSSHPGHKHIHKAIRKHAPKSVQKIKKLFSFKYHKLFLLLLAIILSYYLFTRPEIQNMISGLDRLSYLGIFIAGILLALGFSSPFSIGFFITAKPENLFLAILIGGVGAVIGDMLIFKTIKFSFMDEFKELEKTEIIKTIEKAVKHNKNILIRHYLLYIFGGIIIASPFPDEIGISMLAGLTTIKTSTIALMGFILHSLVISLIFCFSIIL